MEVDSGEHEPGGQLNIVAQGTTDTLGCRIFVDDELKDENSATGVHALTFCLVKSA